MGQEADHGQLQQACTLGQECRIESVSNLQAYITHEWETILTGFKSNLKAFVLKTQVAVDETWDEQIVCHEENPCCPYPETEILNLYIQIDWNKHQITELHQEITLLQKKITEIEEECPEEVALTF